MLSMLAGAAMSLGAAAAQQSFTESNRQRDFANYQAAQEQNFVNSQDAQRNAPVMTRLGMQAAGLNPADMGQPTPATAASAPLGSHASSSVNFAQDTALLAESRLKNAEADQKEIEVSREKHKDTSALNNYMQQIRSVTNAYRERGWTDQADELDEELANLDKLKEQGKLDFNLGDLHGAVEAFGTVDKMQERLQSQIARIFETEKNFKLLVGNRAEDIAAMPSLQRDLMEKQISLSAAQAALFMSEKDVNEEQVDNLIKMREKMNYEIDQLEQSTKLSKAQAESIRNADWKSLFRNGEFLAGTAAFTDDYAKEILHTLGGLANAYVGLKTGKGIIQKMGQKTIQHEYIPSNPNGTYQGYKPNTPSHLLEKSYDG